MTLTLTQQKLLYYTYNQQNKDNFWITLLVSDHKNKSHFCSFLIKAHNQKM